MFTGNQQLRKIGVCEVCRKLDGDSSAKPVEWCATCRADICGPCQRDWTRRLKAAALKGLSYTRAI